MFVLMLVASDPYDFCGSTFCKKKCIVLTVVVRYCSSSLYAKCFWHYIHRQITTLLLWCSFVGSLVVNILLKSTLCWCMCVGLLGSRCCKLIVAWNILNFHGNKVFSRTWMSWYKVFFIIKHVSLHIQTPRHVDPTPCKTSFVQCSHRDQMILQNFMQPKEKS